METVGAFIFFVAVSGHEGLGTDWGVGERWRWMTPRHYACNWRGSVARASRKSGCCVQIASGYRPVTSLE